MSRSWRGRARASAVRRAGAPAVALPAFAGEPAARCPGGRAPAAALPACTGAPATALPSCAGAPTARGLGGRAPAAALPPCTGALAARRAGAGCGAGAVCLRRGCWGLEAGRWRGAQVLGGGRRRRDGRGTERWWRRPVLWACGLGYAWMFDSSNWQLLG